MWYLIVAVIIFIIAFIFLCVAIKNNLHLPIYIYDFEDFMIVIGLLCLFSAAWIVAIPLIILIGIAYWIFLYIDD